MSREDRLEREARRQVEASFRDRLAAGETDGPGSDEVAAYVDGSMEPADRAAFLELLAVDPALRDEVADLEDLRDALGREARTSRPWAAWTGLAAAAGLAALLLWRALPPTPTARPVPVEQASAPIVTLRDGEREVTLSGDGSLAGLPAVPLELTGAVVAALRDGALPRPEAVGALRRAAGTLLGPSPAAAFGLAAPVATLVRSDRPTLRWMSHPRARGYEVTVFSEEQVKVAGVRTAAVTEATLPSSLERGRTYLWQVAALTPEGRIVAPAPPEPPARLRVLGKAESAALESALRAAGDSDLVAGILLARAGVRDEAEARLARLQAANPESAEAARLLAAVRNW
jgi:hypothetical protein